MLIHEKIIAVMRDSEAISKDRKNTSQGYSFRGIDDVYASLHCILARHGVFTLPEVLSERVEERLSKNGGTLIYRVLTIKYHFYAEDGSSVQSVVIGEGMDNGDKASNKAMSVAHKYALLQAFCIPTDDAKDPENESHEVKSKSETKPEVNPIQAECAKLSEELNISKEVKHTMWIASGQNFSNLVLMLRDEKKKHEAEKLKAFDATMKKLDEAERIMKEA